MHPDDLQRCLAAHEAATGAREPFQVEYRLRRHDGVYRWVLDQAVPRFAAGAFLGFAGAAVDITERKQAELALAAAKEAAEADGRDQGRFLATLTHELRTPLAPVLAVVSSLEADAGLPEEARRAVGGSAATSSWRRG